MEEKEWLSKGLDKEVIPLVKFFNENGLPTYMSCQGHNQTNMSMFWIQFDKSVSEDDILNFMKQHPSKSGSFFSNGRFAKRIFGFYSVPDGAWKKAESWNYFAATIEAANSDLQRWKNDNDIWKGINGEDFQESCKRYVEKTKKRYMCTIEDAEIGNKVIVSDYFSRKVSMPDGMRELVGKIVTIMDVVGDMVKIKEENGNAWINISLFNKIDS